MPTGTTGREALPPTRRAAPSINAPTRRVEKPGASPRPAPTPVVPHARQRPPAPGRRTATPRAECPGCRALLPAGGVVCVECGYCLTTQRFLRGSTIQSRLDEPAPEGQVGFLKLGAGMFTSPVQTMDSFLYHAGRTDLLWKVVAFVVFGIVVNAFAASLGHPARFDAALGVQTVQFVVFVACLLAAGTVLGERSSFLGAAVGIGFVSGVVQVAFASLIIGAWFSAGVLLTHPYLAVGGLLAFFVWALFMHVVAIRGVFSCGTVVAIGIAILAAIIDWFAWKAISAGLSAAM